MCLDIVHKLLAALKPAELKEMLPAVCSFASHPSPVCRERMYDILMWIQDNYRSAPPALTLLGCYWLLAWPSPSHYIQSNPCFSPLSLLSTEGVVFSMSGWD